jgi:hypothetical protein
MKKLFFIMLILPVLVGAQVSNTSKVDGTTNTIVGKTPMDTMTEEEKVESVKTVVDAVNTAEKEGDITEGDIRIEIKKTIDDSIINIREKNTEVQAYELSKEINETENAIYIDVNTTLDNGVLNTISDVDALQTRVDTGLDNIEFSLEKASGVDVDISKGKENVKNVLAVYRTQVEKNQILIEDRGGELLNKDTDGDGLSDYDEVYIYNTDPENAYTTGGELSDSEKILRGINPIDAEETEIAYSDPRTDMEAYVSDTYSVKRVELIDAEGQKRIRLEGRALPNSYTTLYIYSTPVIVTVKTDGRGDWSYTLDRELETGEHSVYVATVNNSGRLLARSTAIPFTQTAEAATIGTFGIGDTAVLQNSFIQENFILVILVILLAAILITLMLTGQKKKDESDKEPVITEEKSDINPTPGI